MACDERLVCFVGTPQLVARAARELLGWPDSVVLATVVASSPEPAAQQLPLQRCGEKVQQLVSCSQGTAESFYKGDDVRDECAGARTPERWPEVPQWPWRCTVPEKGHDGAGSGDGMDKGLVPVGKAKFLGEPGDALAVQRVC